MAYSFVQASSQYLSVSASIVTVFPFTISAWFNADDITGDHTLLAWADTGGDSNWGWLSARGDRAGDPVQAADRTTAFRYKETADSFTVGNWHHAGGVWTSTPSREPFLDGVGPGPFIETNADPDTTDTWTIGALVRNTIGNYADADIAEVAIWNAALSDEEVKVLAAGYSPLLVRPSALLAYWPLVRSLHDVVGGYDMVATNGPTVVAHPPIIYPSAQILQFPPSVSVSNELAATLSGALTVAANMDAKGSLTAAQAFTLSIAADLDGLGQLKAAASLIMTVAADLRATGNLQAATTLQLLVLADLDATGSLSAAASLALTVAVNLSATGNLIAAANVAFTVTADIGIGSTNELIANPSISLLATPDIDAFGKLEAATDIALSVTAGLSGSGALQATPTLSLSAIADLDAAGQVSAVLPIALSVAADVKAPGELAVAAALILSVTAAITDANAIKVINLVARDARFQVALRTLIVFAEKNTHTARFTEVKTRDVDF